MTRYILALLLLASAPAYAAHDQMQVSTVAWPNRNGTTTWVNTDDTHEILEWAKLQIAERALYRTLAINNGAKAYGVSEERSAEIIDAAVREAGPTKKREMYGK